MRRLPRGVRRSVDRGTCGLGIEPRNVLHPECRRFPSLGRQHGPPRHRKRRFGSAGSKTPCTHASTSQGRRQPPAVREPGDPAFGSDGGPSPRRESERSKTAMNESGKSDKPVVPGKPAKARATGSFWELFARTQRVEGRGLAKENGEQAGDGVRHIQKWLNAGVMEDGTGSIEHADGRGIRPSRPSASSASRTCSRPCDGGCCAVRWVGQTSQPCGRTRVYE
jgi:hypothetical protein